MKNIEPAQAAGCIFTVVIVGLMLLLAACPYIIALVSAYWITH